MQPLVNRSPSKMFPRFPSCCRSSKSCHEQIRLGNVFAVRKTCKKRRSREEEAWKTPDTVRKGLVLAFGRPCKAGKCTDHL